MPIYVYVSIVILFNHQNGFFQPYKCGTYFEQGKVKYRKGK